MHHNSCFLSRVKLENKKQNKKTNEKNYTNFNPAFKRLPDFI